MAKDRKPEKIEPTAVGVAGEYFVVAELTRLGHLAALHMRNTKGIDILVSNKDGTKFASIQVKTNQGLATSWLLNVKAEKMQQPTLFYVLVNLRAKSERPEYHVVPSAVVAAYIKQSHQDWLSKPGKKGRIRNDSNVRKFDLKSREYLDKWDSLGLG